MVRPLGPASSSGGALACTGWCWPLRHPSHPASVGLACRPVGAWPRHLVKQLDSTRGAPGHGHIVIGGGLAAVRANGAVYAVENGLRTHLVRSASAEFASRARWTRWRSLQVS